MQGKTLYTILLSIIAVLTLALAVLIIVLFTFNANIEKGMQTANNAVQRIVPPSEQAEFKLYGNSNDSSTDAVFNIKSTSQHPNSFIMASVSIIYDGGKKNKLLEERQDLIERVYLSQLKEATIEYFRNQTFEELQASDSMKIAREELKEIYNDIVSNQGTEERFIIKVVFDKWILQ
ncbi:MAG: flagellar basal body-associated FliL family protein [Clostridiaceae bacterium]|nr:flagellar basal body-associated FliL family protein [Clostridiaceae bacterium]